VLIAMTHWLRAKLTTTQLEKAIVIVEKSEKKVWIKIWLNPKSLLEAKV